MNTKKMRSDCPVSYALDFFGDKWTFLIIRDLVDGKRFNKEFSGSKERIASNILADRLKKLESAGIVESSVYEKQKTQKEYFLTEKGKDLIPILIEMIVWSSKHEEGLAVSDRLLQRAQDNRKELIQDIRASLK